jgi:hypothetical protein
MFDRKGYVSLSRLWSEFETKFLFLVKERALECLEADLHASDFAFGTALDLCEDVFLRTFDNILLELVPVKGEVVTVQPVLARSGARLLLKTTAFESVQICVNDGEAGPDGKLLRRMGSSAFDVADLGWLWPGNRGRATGEDAQKILFANVFNTLPVLFERSSFVIARELPPWSEDLLEDTYLRNITEQTRGSSICLSDASVRKWKKTLTPQMLERVLGPLIPNVVPDAELELLAKGGRPTKVATVVKAYLELGLMDKNLVQKQELLKIQEHINNTVSLSTLGRAMNEIRKDKPKTNGNEEV